MTTYRHPAAAPSVYRVKRRPSHSLSNRSSSSICSDLEPGTQLWNLACPHFGAGSDCKSEVPRQGTRRVDHDSSGWQERSGELMEGLKPCSWDALTTLVHSALIVGRNTIRSWLRPKRAVKALQTAQGGSSSRLAARIRKPRMAGHRQVYSKTSVPQNTPGSPILCTCSAVGCFGNVATPARDGN